ncbi:response regulator [Sulfitobacter sp. HNIBRBA2951]|uniref:response regulator n=1 Tax=Sulfitobacter aquimarinus TaxID=3158557 RepID=UPI0032E0170B
MSLPATVMESEGGPRPERIKALLLDDSTFDRARIRRLSDKTRLMVDVTEVCDMTQMKEAVAREGFDLILIDYRLPQGDGLEVLDFIQQSALNRDAATIMITGNGDMETAVTAMRNGCHDFLTKEAMTAEQLRFAMVGAMEAAANRRALAAQSRQQREVIRAGLKDALMDREVQGAVVALFRNEVSKMAQRGPVAYAAQDHSDLDAILATLGDDDEFIFR